MPTATVIGNHCVCDFSSRVSINGACGAALKFAARYAISLLALWAMLNLAVAFPRLPRAAALAAIIALWINLALGISVLLQWPSLQVSLVFHAEDTFKYLLGFQVCMNIRQFWLLLLGKPRRSPAKHSRGELGQTVPGHFLLGAIAAL